MVYRTRRELEEENESLREALESVMDQVSEALEIDAEEETDQDSE